MTSNKRIQQFLDVLTDPEKVALIGQEHGVMVRRDDYGFWLLELPTQHDALAQIKLDFTEHATPAFFKTARFEDVTIFANPKAIIAFPQMAGYLVNGHNPKTKICIGLKHGATHHMVTLSLGCSKGVVNYDASDDADHRRFVALTAPVIAADIQKRLVQGGFACRPVMNYQEHVKITTGIRRNLKKNRRTACANCGARQKKLSLCGGCRNVAYCGGECQRSHWKSAHKIACAALAAATKSIMSVAKSKTSTLKVNPVPGPTPQRGDVRRFGNELVDVIKQVKVMALIQEKLGKLVGMHERKGIWLLHVDEDTLKNPGNLVQDLKKATVQCAMVQKTCKDLAAATKEFLAQVEGCAAPGTGSKGLFGCFERMVFIDSRLGKSRLYPGALKLLGQYDPGNQNVLLIQLWIGPSVEDVWFMPVIVQFGLF